MVVVGVEDLFVGEWFMFGQMKNMICIYVYCVLEMGYLVLYEDLEIIGKILVDGFDVD